MPTGTSRLMSVAIMLTVACDDSKAKDLAKSRVHFKRVMYFDGLDSISLPQDPSYLVY